MKLEKLTRLISALNTPAPKVQENTDNSAGQGNAAAQTEAVKVSNDFGYGVEQSSGENREQKVERLKREVQAGAYRVDSREIAKSVIRELFV